MGLGAGKAVSKKPWVQAEVHTDWAVPVEDGDSRWGSKGISGGGGQSEQV